MFASKIDVKCSVADSRRCGRGGQEQRVVAGFWGVSNGTDRRLRKRSQISACVRCWWQRLSVSSRSPPNLPLKVSIAEFIVLEGLSVQVMLVVSRFCQNSRSKSMDYFSLHQM